MLQSNNLQKRRVNQALADCDSYRKLWAWDKLFQYFEYDCLISRHRSSLEKSERRKADQIDEANERLLERGERNCVVKFGWWRECEDLSCHSCKKNKINWSEARAEARDNVSAEFPEEPLRLFGHDITLDLYNTFLDYSPYSDEGAEEEGSIMPLAHLDASTAKAVIYLK